ncbi:MAG: hypothetical protein CSA04_02670 [Bacteroidetes bacterium]|nr:MAG: hypothetical protein CSA04_02670 [Bacteroidota bacterium]
MISALGSATAAIFEKKALLKNDAQSFSLMVSAITAVFTLPFLFFVHLPSLSFTAIGLLFLKSLLGATAFLWVMKGLKENDISNALPLLVFTPAIVALLAFFLLDEKISPTEIGGMTLLLLGTYLLQLENKEWLSPFYFLRRHRSQWYLIGAILLFSTTSILDKTLLKGYKLPPEAFLPLQQLFYTLIFLTVFMLRGKKGKPLRKQFGETQKLLIAVAILTLLYRYSHILAVKTGAVALVLSIKRTSVFFAALLGGRYFREKHLARRSLATLIMVVGAIVILLS